MNVQNNCWVHIYRNMCSKPGEPISAQMRMEIANKSSTSMFAKRRTTCCPESLK